MGDFCSIAKPLRPSAAAAAVMDDREKRDILAFNRYGEASCGWRP